MKFLPVEAKTAVSSFTNGSPTKKNERDPKTNLRKNRGWKRPVRMVRNANQTLHGDSPPSGNLSYVLSLPDAHVPKAYFRLLKGDIWRHSLKKEIEAVLFKYVGSIDEEQIKSKTEYSILIQRLFYAEELAAIRDLRYESL